MLAIFHGFLRIVGEDKIALTPLNIWVF